MRVLLINKFLHPNGGSETYVFQLGQELQRQGHEVQYFGMDNENRQVGNRVEAYTSHMDFHSSRFCEKLSYSLRTIYSREARKKLRLVLEDFQPDVCHLNNFHYQLTPSILLEICRWRRSTGKRCPIVCTAHDFQLVCPNHLCRNGKTKAACEKCLEGRFYHCVLGRCIHGSLCKSILGALEAYFWHRAGVYQNIDKIICCSAFLKSRLDRDPVLAKKTTVMRNFVEEKSPYSGEKKDYILYFGRYCREKGMETLVQAARQLPQIPFVFAGCGPMEELLEGIPNVKNVGFQTGEALDTWIREARFTVCPSECYDNCPFSVLESLTQGTPVLCADIGGIPELIQEGQTGELFESGNEMQLREKIRSLWEDPQCLHRYSHNCTQLQFRTLAEYVHVLETQYACDPSASENLRQRLGDCSGFLPALAAKSLGGPSSGSEISR